MPTNLGTIGAMGAQGGQDALDQILAARLKAALQAKADAQQEIENKQRDRQLTAQEEATREATADRRSRELDSRNAAEGMAFDRDRADAGFDADVTRLVNAQRKDNPIAQRSVLALRKVTQPDSVKIQTDKPNYLPGTTQYRTAPKPAPVDREPIRQSDTVLTGQFDPQLKGKKGVRVYTPDMKTLIAEIPQPVDQSAEELKQQKLKPLDVSGDVQHTMRGTPYVSLENYTPTEREKVREAARGIEGEAGPVRVISKEAADGLRAADTARANLDKMLVQIKDMLPKDPSGRILDGPINKVGQFFQSDAGLGAFGSWRTAAIQTVQSLAEKGMGLRLNRAEIDLALENDIPKITDTWATALQRVKNLNALLDSKEDATLNGDRRTMRVQGGVNAPPDKEIRKTFTQGPYKGMEGVSTDGGKTFSVVVK